MDALEKVFETIMEVLNIIKNFFAQLFPQDNEGEGETKANPEA